MSEPRIDRRSVALRVLAALVHGQGEREAAAIVGTSHGTVQRIRRMALANTLGAWLGPCNPPGTTEAGRIDKLVNDLRSGRVQPRQIAKAKEAKQRQSRSSSEPSTPVIFREARGKPFYFTQRLVISDAVKEHVRAINSRPQR